MRMESRGIAILRPVHAERAEAKRGSDSGYRMAQLRVGDRRLDRVVIEALAGLAAQITKLHQTGQGGGGGETCG